ALDASAGLAKDAGKTRLAATLALSRAAYGDAKLSGGGTLSQEERNSTLLTATLRAGYEVSPSLVPFVEISGGRRFMDLATDAAGYDRSAYRLALRGGLEIDRGEKLRGEVSVGWLRESFDDTRLASLSGLSVDGTLTWSPVRETTMTLRGTTSVEGTTTAGNSGSLLHSAEARIARAIRENLTGEIGAGVSLRDYAGSSDLDVIASGTASLTWWLNRYAGITGRVRYEQVSSTLAGMDSRTGSAFLGLTLRR
ncbi:MAG: outer membrane beta-barrel protein, partial [Rhizobiaceae bacterium]